MSAQASIEAADSLVVHADRRGCFHVLKAGEDFVETGASQREQVERDAAELRGQAIDETALLVAHWSRTMALHCAAALRRGQDAQALKPTTS
jgi:hypothetical protein